MFALGVGGVAAVVFLRIEARLELHDQEHTSTFLTGMDAPAHDATDNLNLETKKKEDTKYFMKRKTPTHRVCRVRSMTS